MRITYDFYRRHVQTEKAKIKHRYIPMSQWESELSKMEGPHISLHDTENLEDLNDLPTKEDVIDVISKMRGNTAPGIDGIVSELFKYMPEQLLLEVVQHMQRAWLNNEIPTTWTQTTQIPIPRPSMTTDEYQFAAQATEYMQVYCWIDLTNARHT